MTRTAQELRSGDKTVLIRCWGARGSIPVSGPHYSVYGGDTTCLEIRTASNDLVIIDAGSGIRALGNSLVEQDRLTYTMLLTHGHWDHIIGFPFFKPLHNPRAHVHVYGCRFERNSLKDVLAPSMSPPSFPIKIEDIQAELTYHDICAGSFALGPLHVCTINLSHPNQGLGYRFTEGGCSFVFLTDNELGYRHPGGLDYADYVAFARGADVLLHDAEYTADEYAHKKTWGHTVYTQALQLALDAGVGRLGLFHHNQDHSDAEVDAMVQDCRRIVAGRSAGLEVFGTRQGMDIQVSSGGG
jgi:phosphoribosyl 1,2-cyclic phosphodiesterase